VSARLRPLSSVLNGSTVRNRRISHGCGRYPKRGSNVLWKSFRKRCTGRDQRRREPMGWPSRLSAPTSGVLTSSQLSRCSGNPLTEVFRWMWLIPVIVLVHGIDQQQLSADSLEKEWLPALAGGVRTAGFPDVADRLWRVREGEAPSKRGWPFMDI